MPLQAGVWSVNANGHEGQLHIAEPDEQGIVGGRIFGDVFHGFWTETSQRLMFIRNPAGRDSSHKQVYTAFLFDTRRTDKFTLAGYFEAFEGTGATSARNVFG
jgi:hypothetical protein